MHQSLTLSLLFILPLLSGIRGHYHYNENGQIILDDDDVLHPEWPLRQAALGWQPWDATWGNSDEKIDFGAGVNDGDNKVGGCGGVCVLTPEVMEGPFYLDYHIERNNITESIPGLPLDLTLTVYSISINETTINSDKLAASKGTSECDPLAGAWVDMWSCDSEGVYSGYGKMNKTGPGGPGGGHKRPPPGPPPGGPRRKGPGGPGGGGPDGHAEPTTNATFLRGVQQTGEDGRVTFHTIYPGWYPGRTTHIHLKVHPPSWSTSESTTNSTHTFTTQLFFPDTANEYISSLHPYKENIVKRTSNEEDGLYREMGGASVVKIEWYGEVHPGKKIGDVGGGKVKYVDGGVKASLAIGVDKWW